MLGMILALEGLVGLGACIGAAVAAIGAGKQQSEQVSVSVRSAHRQWKPSHVNRNQPATSAAT